MLMQPEVYDSLASNCWISISCVFAGGGGKSAGRRSVPHSVEYFMLSWFSVVDNIEADTDVCSADVVVSFGSVFLSEHEQRNNVEAAKKTANTFFIRNTPF